MWPRLAVVGHRGLWGSVESTEERGHSTGEERRRSEGKSASVAEENPSVALSCWGDVMKSCSGVLSTALGGR